VSAAPGLQRRGDRGAARGIPPLGQILRTQGAIAEADLRRALAAQAETGQRLGDTILAHGLAEETALAEAIAEQQGLVCINLERSPPDPALIASGDLDIYLHHRILPWRQAGGVTLFAAADPDELDPAVERLGLDRSAAAAVVVTRSDLERALHRYLGPDLARAAALRTAEDHSARAIGGLCRLAVFALAAGALALAVIGEMAVIAALALLFVINGATTALRIAALLAGRRRPDSAKPAASDAVNLSNKRAPPVISILVPLYSEAGMIGEIIRALSALDYPRELTEVVILLEESDATTRAALAEVDLSGWMRTVIVPDGVPRTKPRALNHGLGFCRGEIIGILDAEDRPEPGQLATVAEALRNAPPEMACVQCQLAYYNARENWITRCFQIEYAIWFEVLLRGFRALDLPIPLGGTSVYFRRSALIALGAWDAHNVTEDADLGMRLARAGLGCGVLRSTTYEEANCRAATWIRQRSRWLKGYLITWLSHMRRPGRLWSELGARGFFGLNIVFLGAATAYLALPLFWLAVLGWATTGSTLWASTLPGWAIWPAGLSLAFGQAVMLGCAALALRRRGALGLMPWVLTLPVYWTLGAVAAWKAVIELPTAPFYWDKTRHGLSRYLRPGSEAISAAE